MNGTLKICFTLFLAYPDCEMDMEMEKIGPELCSGDAMHVNLMSEQRHVR